MLKCFSRVASSLGITLVLLVLTLLMGLTSEPIGATRATSATVPADVVARPVAIKDVKPANPNLLARPPN